MVVEGRAGYFVVAWLVKNLPANVGDVGLILGLGRPPLKIPWMEEPGELQSKGSQKVECN